MKAATSPCRGVASLGAPLPAGAAAAGRFGPRGDMWQGREMFSLSQPGKMLGAPASRGRAWDGPSQQGAASPRRPGAGPHAPAPPAGGHAGPRAAHHLLHRGHRQHRGAHGAAPHAAGGLAGLHRDHARGPRRPQAVQDGVPRVRVRGRKSRAASRAPRAAGPGDPARGRRLPPTAPELRGSLRSA